MSSRVAAAAFGGHPGQWPLPAAHGPHEHWLRAVAAAGQGRYAAARTDLAGLIHDPSAGRWCSLSRSAHASFLRQLGWHWRAHDWDGRAWAAAGGDAEAGADALIGLAADALGVGRFGASAALLEQAAGLVARADESRLDIRLAWVRAELAMFSGHGADAVRHAQRGVELAEEALPELRRHRVKSDVVLAAALCSAGRIDAARSVADKALADAATYGLVPLRWAISCLLADIGSATHTASVIVGVRESSAQFVTRHGGDWKIR